MARLSQIVSGTPTLLSVCTIMKNEERLLPEFLDSVLPFAGDLVLVDTGSTDRSVDLARERGVECHHFEWCDHFSKARNFSLERARGDWILVLDVDDRVLPATFELLFEHLPKTDADALYFPYVSLRFLDWKNTLADVKAVQTRLMVFRNNKGYHYRNPVHEKIDTVIEEMGGSFVLLDSKVYHLGYAEELDQLKADRNRKMILENFRRDPTDPHFLHNYITVIWSADQEVYKHCLQAYEISPTDGKYLAAQRILQWIDGFSIPELPDGKSESYWEEVLLSINPRAAYVHLRRGRKSFERQDIEQSLTQYQLARTGLQFELTSLTERHEILDRLGVLLAMKGRLQEALDCFRELEKYEGRNAGTYHQILKVLFALGQREEFLEEWKCYPSDLMELAEAKRKELLNLLRGASIPEHESLQKEFRIRCGLKIE